MKSIEFFSRSFRTTLLFILAVELLSFFVYWLKDFYDISLIAFGLVLCLVFFVSLFKIKYGLYAVLVELFIGSQGHLLSIELFNFKLSLRIGLFAVIMLAWLIWFIRQKKWSILVKPFKIHKELYWLAGAIIWALIFAFIRQNSLINIFNDFNAWLYFLYLLPFLTVLTEQKQLNKILQIFIACLTAQTLKALTFLFIFAHNMPIMRDLYKWGRDTRWGEFTLIDGGFYRVFAQSQIFVLIGIFIILGYLIFKGKLNYRQQKNQFLAIILFLSLTTIMLSLSRSFWLALILSGLLLIIFSLFIYKQKVASLGKLIIQLGFIAVLSYALIVSVINFPYPNIQTPTGTGKALTERLNLSDAAVSSRWSQLPNLTSEIIKHPVIGSGWGSTVTYQSQDPRILTVNNPEGWYTTYAFEWGYLDFIYKFGLIGLFIYLMVLWNISKKLWLIWKKNTDRRIRALISGLTIGLFALIVVHGFTPYLNHPLGIGYIITLYTMINLLTTPKPLSETPADH